MSDTQQYSTKICTFGGEQFELAFRKAVPIDDPASGYDGFTPGKTSANGIIYDRDVAVKMRDGITIYIDIYRPEGTASVPAVVAWSPYGKRQGYMGRIVPGVPTGTVSPMAKFEGPDPAYWCHHGYAVINPDIRGAFKSEGDLSAFCSGEGRDCYDLIEWLAGCDWCNGKVAMSGNSWLAIAQWFAAAERPPHLAAIAPWEGFDDFYRDSLFPGGIPEVGFVGRGATRNCSSGQVEHVPYMMQRYPMINAYWEDRAAKIENIEVPAYVVASYTSIHSRGTFDAYRRLPSSNKWLRVHNTQEWPDYYRPENLEDLRRFFDRYLKEIHNGWELTPRVRISVLDPGGKDQVNRPEEDFPLPQTRYEKLFLDARSGKLMPNPVKKESSISYISDDGKGQATFTMQFKEDSEITGYINLRLWVEAAAANDMDIFVFIQKLDQQGNFLASLVLGQPFPGAPGYLRVSHREINPARSTPFLPFLTHRQEQLLSPKEIVAVEISICPMGMLWHAGQQLRIVIQGFGKSWMDTLHPGQPIFKYDLRNQGEHIIHTGGKYDSYLLVPIISR